MELSATAVVGVETSGEASGGSERKICNVYFQDSKTQAAFDHRGRAFKQKAPWWCGTWGGTCGGE